MGCIDVLLLQKVNQFDITVLPKVSPQLLFVVCIKIFDVTDVHVTGGATVHGNSDSRR